MGRAAAGGGLPSVRPPLPRGSAGVAPPGPPQVRFTSQVRLLGPTGGSPFRRTGRCLTAQLTSPTFMDIASMPRWSICAPLEVRDSRPPLTEPREVDKQEGGRARGALPAPHASACRAYASGHGSDTAFTTHARVRTFCPAIPSLTERRSCTAHQASLTWQGEVDVLSTSRWMEPA